MEIITMNKIISYYQNLEAKEQKYLQAAAVALVVFFIYQFIFLSYQESFENIQKQQHYNAELNLWLKKNIPENIIKKEQANKIELTNSKLLSNTDNSLKQSSLKNSHYELSQSSESSAQLSFKKIPYVDFIRWLEQFFKQRALNIKTLNIVGLKEPGMVSATLEFEIA